MDFLKKKMKDFLDDDKDKHGEHGGGEHARDGDHGQAQSYYQQGHGGPPPPQSHDGPPPSGPQLPPGWTQQWDQNSQRYYYVEQGTGRTQWEPPSFGHGGPPPFGGYSQGYPGQHGGEHDRGMFGGGHGSHGDHGGYGHGGYGSGGYGPGGHGYGDHGHDKDKDKNSALKYGLGGAAVGALAGGVIAHEMTETSDDEGHHVTQSTTYAAAPPPAGDPYADAPPPVPTETADGDSISSSDRESMEEAREDLEEAQKDYNEEVEESYDD